MTDSYLIIVRIMTDSYLILLRIITDTLLIIVRIITDTHLIIVRMITDTHLIIVRIIPHPTRPGPASLSCKDLKPFSPIPTNVMTSPTAPIPSPT